MIRSESMNIVECPRCRMRVVPKGRTCPSCQHELRDVNQLRAVASPQDGKGIQCEQCGWEFSFRRTRPRYSRWSLLLYFLAGIVTVLLYLLATDYPRVPGKWISSGAGLLLGFAGYYFPRRRDLDCPRCDWKRTEWIRPVWRESAASLVRER